MINKGKIGRQMYKNGVSKQRFPVERGSGLMQSNKLFCVIRALLAKYVTCTSTCGEGAKVSTQKGGFLLEL